MPSFQRKINSLVEVHPRLKDMANELQIGGSQEKWLGLTRIDSEKRNTDLVTSLFRENLELSSQMLDCLGVLKENPDGSFVIFCSW